MAICNECPYLKKSTKGWLGQSSWNPQEFLRQLDLVFVHPCHKAVDWESADESEIMDAPVCSGAIQFAKNTCKRLEFPPYEQARNALSYDDTKVFGRRSEFIEHHSKSTA